MSDIREEKRALRAQCRAAREALADPEKDETIARLAFSAFSSYSRFFVYLSFGSEVSTARLIGSLRAAGKPVCAPRVRGKEMMSVLLTEKTERGAFGIDVPAEGEETVCEVAFVPLVAADEDGFRLGYGGGYYDRYFAEHPSVIRAGLAYEGQVLPRLPREEWDLPLDFLVTEAGIRRFRRNA